jgi:SAM-dependent methyltransferase
MAWPRMVAGSAPILTQRLIGAFIQPMDDDYQDSTYGDRIAEVFDARAPTDGEAAARFLKVFAGQGPALELGVGTGRVAIPLTRTGVDVYGIDASRAMVDRMRSAPGGDVIRVQMGSFADFSFETRFSLVYVVFNTFFGLLSQEEQVSCFAATARHLLPSGVFVMQAFIPDVRRFDAREQRVSVDRVGVDEIDLETSTHDPVAQRTNSQRVVIRGGTIRQYPVRIRYAYVSELDLMARLAGLRLRERWSDWDRSTFTSASGTHISVWELDRVDPG